MSKTPEIKVAEQITNLTENHWFNPAVMGRYLADQPFYTTDRIMELVIQIIHWQGKRHIDELDGERGLYNSGETSEGLFLANELSKHIDKLKQAYVWENIQMPVNPAEVIKNLPKVETQSYRYSWLHETNNGPTANLNVQAVI